MDEGAGGGGGGRGRRRRTLSFLSFATRKQQKPRIEARSREHRGPAPGTETAAAGLGPAGGKVGHPPKKTPLSSLKRGCADPTPPREHPSTLLLGSPSPGGALTPPPGCGRCPGAQSRLEDGGLLYHPEK